MKAYQTAGEGSSSTCAEFRQINEHAIQDAIQDCSTYHVDRYGSYTM